MKTANQIIACLLLAAIGFFLLLERDKAYPRPYAAEGQPVCVTDYPEPDNMGEQVLAVDGYIYLLLSGDRMLQVYDNSGNYICTWFLYNNSQKGGIAMGEQNGAVYVEDTVSNIYYFRGAQFERFISRDDPNVPYPKRTNTPGYWINSRGIWKNVDGEKVCIIPGPTRSVFEKILIAITVIWGALSVAARIYNRKKRSDRLSK